ncbi:DUF3795 domain-containing protein [bacterium]|nr:DUF3795 domain-containing protein [bacterium]
MDYKLDAYCGLYCGACGVFKANKMNIVEETAKKWKLKPENIRCHGCKSDMIAVFCTDCHLKLCAEKKKVEFCYECDEYPCENLLNFRNDEHPHHSVILNNLEYIKENGLQEWLRQQAKRWSCSKCGTEFSWYEETCQSCGTKLHNAEDEDKTLNNK